MSATSTMSPDVLEKRAQPTYEEHHSNRAAPGFNDQERARIKECVGLLSSDWAADFIAGDAGEIVCIGPCDPDPEYGGRGFVVFGTSVQMRDGAHVFFTLGATRGKYVVMTIMGSTSVHNTVEDALQAIGLYALGPYEATQ